MSGISGLSLSGLASGIGGIGGVNSGLTNGLMGSLGGLSGLSSVPKSGEVAGLQHLLEAAQRYHTAEDSQPNSSETGGKATKRFRSDIPGHPEGATRPAVA